MRCSKVVECQWVVDYWWPEGWHAMMESRSYPTETMRPKSFADALHIMLETLKNDPIQKFEGHYRLRNLVTNEIIPAELFA